MIDTKQVFPAMIIKYQYQKCWLLGNERSLGYIFSDPDPPTSLGSEKDLHGDGEAVLGDPVATLGGTFARGVAFVDTRHPLVQKTPIHVPNNSLHRQTGEGIRR